MSVNPLTAVLWDFGGVITTSPFDAFARYEETQALPAGFLRTLNATNPDSNAWALLERGQVDIDEFVGRFEAEALAAGGQVDARVVLASLEGQVRPAMVEAVRRCHQHLKTGLLTNNFVVNGETNDHSSVLESFDLVLESSRAGCRKPDPRFYRMACEMLSIHPSQAVFLDDLGINLKPARAMGMRTIKVTDPDVALRELESVVGFDLTGSAPR